MALPLGQPWDQSSVKWKSQVDPLLANPACSPKIIQNITLASGVNVINHGLAQMQQGWYITDINASAIIYRSQPFNSSTITLTSSSACVIDLAVF